MYESGMALMALASSRCPDCIARRVFPRWCRQTLSDIAQDMVDSFAYCQTDPIQGLQGRLAIRLQLWRLG